MAQRGAKVTIHGRRREKLEEMANQIEELSGTRVSRTSSTLPLGNAFQMDTYAQCDEARISSNHSTYELEPSSISPT